MIWAAGLVAAAMSVPPAGGATPPPGPPAMNGDAAINGARAAEPRPIAPDPHPFTLEPGRFLLEFAPLNYARDREPGVRVDTWTAPFTLKFGVLENVDVHVGADILLSDREDDRDAGTRTLTRGFGDVILRTKWNLWGNDGGDTALALMPTVRIPTRRINGDRSPEAGLLVPMAVFPWEGFDIEWTPGFSAVRGVEESRYVFEFSSQLVVNQALTDGIVGFVEFGSAVTTERGQPWAGVLGVGLTFEPTADLVIEPAVHFGLTSSAEDLVVSLTIVKRF